MLQSFEGLIKCKGVAATVKQPNLKIQGEQILQVTGENGVRQ